jgi:translation initiation factor IF-3
LAKKFYRLNQYIQASEVRVVNEKGKQIGVMPIKKALELARQERVDLIEIAPKANPPVCKIIDFKKFRFLEEKKAAEERKKSKKVEIKEIHLAPFIARNDFDIRMTRAKEFLRDKNKVKIVVKFRGREMEKKDFGYKLIERTLERLKPNAEIDLEPKFIGNRLELVLRPTKGGKNNEKKDEN